MSTRLARRLAAGTTALALAGLGLVGLGASSASAVDTIPSGTAGFLGSFYLANGNDGTDFAPGASLAWGQPAIALLQPGDLTDPLAPPPAELGADGVTTFLAPQGDEMNKTQWNAYVDTQMISTGQFMQDETPYDLITPGQGSPSGTAATAAVSGDYTLGIAYTKYSGVAVVGWYGVHIHVTGNANPDLATYTWQPVQEGAAPKTTTTTTITSAPTTVQENTDFSLTATVSPSAAGGTVDFKDGSTVLGSPTVQSGGTATLDVTAGLAAGSHSITATYSGDDTYATSTSAPVTIAVTGTPQGTTTTVSATSATHHALDPAVLSANVTAANGSTPTGTVDFSGTLDGTAASGLPTAVAVVNGVASATVSNLTAGTWVISASFHGTGVYQSSASSTPASLTLTVDTSKTYETNSDGSAKDTSDNIKATIPAGALIISTPFSHSNPFDLGSATLNAGQGSWSTAPKAFKDDNGQGIQIQDTRNGQLGFTAELQSSDFVSGPAAKQKFTGGYLGLTGVAPSYLTGNGLSSGVTGTDVPANPTDDAHSLATAQTFATYPADTGTGTVGINATLGLYDVPTSVLQGTYLATLTFDVH